MNRLIGVATVMLLALGGTSTTAQAQWAQFRGPNAGDVGDDPSLPDTWSETENVVWSIDVPGLAWSNATNQVDNNWMIRVPLPRISR